MNKNEINFTRLPTKLIYALDSDLLKMLAILIQQESYWIEHKKIRDDGSFYKSMQEFADIFRKKNLQDVRLILQTLYSERFIDIIQSRSKKHANYYRINWDKIVEYNQIPMPQLIESPLIKTAKRKCKSTVDSTELFLSNANSDSTKLYHQSVENSTESYQQDSELIVQDCTTTIENIINKNNNITKDNSVITKSPLYDKYTKRIEELLSDYQQESDYIVSLDKYSNIENILELAQKHIPTSEIEIYNSQLSEASLVHERKGWNVLLDNISDDLIQQYHITNIHNVKTPLDYHQFKFVLNDTIGRIEMYVSDELKSEYLEKLEMWINHQWDRGAISYDCKQESIDKVYTKLAS